MKYVIGFIFIVALILYLGFRGLESETKPESVQVAAERQSVQDTGVKENKAANEQIGQSADREAGRQEIADKKVEKEALKDQPKSPGETRSEPKRKLVGGAEVEWIEPDTSEPKTKFGMPPE